MARVGEACDTAGKVADNVKGSVDCRDLVRRTVSNVESQIALF